jgi:putative peptidoglycan lipid II flippase
MKDSLLVGDHLFAKTFGAGADLDAYYAAFLIHDTLYALLIISSISSFFLPDFQKYKEQGDWKKSWQFASSVLNTLFLAFIGLALIITIFAPWIVNVYVPAFSLEQKELTIWMVRVMMLSPLFFLFSSFMITIENAFHTFFAQAMAPILYNLGIIAGALFFAEQWGIRGIALGVVCGAGLQMIVQIPFFLKTGFSWSPLFLRGKELQDMAKHFIPRLISASLLQISSTANIIIAGFLTAGSITLYNLAFNVQSISFGMIAVSLSIPAFALLTKHAAKNDSTAFQKILQNTFEKTYFWMIPANLGLFIIAEPLAKFLFEYGKFQASDTALLISLIQLFALGLMLTAGTLVLSKAFLAVQETWLITKIGLLTVFTGILSSFFLAKNFGVQGIVWGTILGLLLQQIILGILSWKRFGKLFSWTAMLKVFIAGAVMVLILWQIVPQLQNLSNLMQMLVISTLGAGVYLGIVKTVKML